MTSGNGGVIGPIPPKNLRSGNSNVVIDDEQMNSPDGVLVVGDATGLVIENSKLGIIKLSPTVSIQGTLENTTYTGIRKSEAASSKIQLSTSGAHQTAG